MRKTFFIALLLLFTLGTIFAPLQGAQATHQWLCDTAFYSDDACVVPLFKDFRCTLGDSSFGLCVAEDRFIIDGSLSHDWGLCTVDSICGHIPDADAGPDQDVIDFDGDGSEDVTFNASGTFDFDGPSDIASYEWRNGALLLGTGISLTVPLPVGIYDITLTVIDKAGNTDIDTVHIEVITIPPQSGGLVPCGRYTDDLATAEINESDDCGFCHFFFLFQGIVNFVVFRIIPALAILMIVLGGITLASSRGNPAQSSKGKDILIWTLVGYLAIFVGWIVLNTVFTSIGVVKWTGLVGEEIPLQKTYGKLLWTPETDLDILPDELVGLVLTISGTGNPSLDGQTRRIIKVWDENDVASGPASADCPDGDPGDLTGTPTGATTKDCIEVDIPLPNVSDANGILKIGGWWQFSCAIEKP